jgi:hypothetical protein
MITRTYQSAILRPLDRKDIPVSSRRRVLACERRSVATVMPFYRIPKLV